MTRENSTWRPEVLDRIAVLLSGLCLVHCLALPFLVILLPFLGQFTDDHLHAEMLVVVIPVSVVALAFGFRKHRQAGIVFTGAIALAIITIGGTVAHNTLGLVADRLLTVIGSLLLAVTHYRNFRLSRHRPVRSSAD